jgi:hypothetical protein
MKLFWLIGAVGLLAWFVRALQSQRFAGRALRLGRERPGGADSLPRLSIVVPARNEEAAVEQAMRTLLAVDYPDVEILAVDDRSTDRTGAILDGLAAESPRLRVLHVRELPAGWLGKNHALHLGARRASGEYILFTDADVHFEPTALRRAVRAAVDRGLDHLVLLPEVVVQGFWETLFVTYFATGFVFIFLPWKVADPRSKVYVGVGAFNLVRREAYRRAGGHAALPMDVVDDLKLGKRLRESGARQEYGFSDGLVRVRWAVGLQGMVDALTKNMFAALGFRVASALSLTLTMLLLVAWPGVGLLVGPWGPRLLCAGALASMVWMVRTVRPVLRGSPLYALAFPVAALLMTYTICRSVSRTYRQGGVVWRGTLYPLEELRKGVV